MKKCRKCGEDDQGAFIASQKTLCKPCKAIYDKAYRLANPEKEAARMKKWQQDNPERTAAKSKKWAQNNPEKVAASGKKWAQANPEKVAAKGKKWRTENPDKDAAKSARRRAAKLQRTPVWHETEKVNQIYTH